MITPAIHIDARGDVVQPPIGGCTAMEAPPGFTLRTARETALEAERDELRRIVEWPNTHAVHYLVRSGRWWAADDACYYYEGATFEEAVRRAIAASDTPPDREPE